MKRTSSRQKIYPHIIPDIRDWPIYHLHQNRRELVEEIAAFTMDQLLQRFQGRMADLLAKSIYSERMRVGEEPWKVDPADDRIFWKKAQQDLAGWESESHTDESDLDPLLSRIVYRYAEEIVGTFSERTFRFARWFLTVFFSRLLNTAAGSIRGFFRGRLALYDRLLAQGEMDKLRSLAQKGTVVLVPTHFSNLDSIVVGYILDFVLGMPAFTYGAGLNLFNTGYVAYFMNRLGAYRVDRRKKSLIYLETLKSMSHLSLQHGAHSLFFPGGTRSRSGGLEVKLKLGLLSSVVEAQRHNLQKGEGGKIFIVPMVISYHVVLEAKFLIDQHLRSTGRERYIRSKDDFLSVFNILAWTWKIFSRSSEIAVSVGKPMDVIGNFVDENGVSYDRTGKEVEVGDYFLSQGVISADEQRESEYTQMLARRIIERFYKENIVLSSHLVAYAAFSLFLEKNSNLDLYAALRLPVEDFSLTQAEMAEAVECLREVLRELESRGHVRLSDVFSEPADRLIADGIRHLGVYHPEKALYRNKQGLFVSKNLKLLYYYHNRLEGYHLQLAFQNRYSGKAVVLPNPGER